MTLRYVQTITPSFDGAACQRYPNNIWFDDVSTAQAVRICQTECPIVDRCREYALTLPVDTEGVWAGMTKVELNRLRRANGNPPVIDHGTRAGYETHRRYSVPMCQPCLNAHAEYQRLTRPSRARPYIRKDRSA